MQQDKKEDKYYNWKEVEAEILHSTNHNQQDVSSKQNTATYSIIMPPPNVTGSLHLGHALDNTLQDALIRHQKLLGNNVLWQPGLDHAGIATQMVVEKKLLENGIKRLDLSREEFVKKVYAWKEESGDTIVNQIKKLGSSANFSYLAFTMDEQSSKGVMEAFVRLHHEGLIYQDNRLVNWDNKLQTVISDLEVKPKEVSKKMYFIKYAIQDTTNYLTIATTRPETIFADAAIAVNPEDDRYANLIGKTVLIPIINKPIKVIADSYVDITKGTGVLKVTPAHDFNDFEIGLRHNLEKIAILDFNGKLNNLAPEEYVGLTTEQAKIKVTAQLTSLGILEKIEDIIASVPYGDRSDTIIEPMITKQWFIDAKQLSKEAIRVVKDKEIKFFPENWQNLYFDWMENIKPWCISRQLWWGHRIPVWYGPDDKIFVAINEATANEAALKFYGKKVNLKQEDDVLDTWFSSGLWPFVTLGWPNNTEKLKTFYPTSVLITGFDIIFFWVARMIMLGTFLTKQIPFKHIYIHGLIKDEHGQKMSKSKGNTIDPLILMDKFGTDALRFALFSYSGQGKDIIISESIIEGYRNFITKIFNAFKFAEGNNCYLNENYNPNNLTLDINKWIVAKFSALQANVLNYYDNYRFSDIGSAIYKTIWTEFCDWYIELAKPILFSDNTKDKQEIQQTIAFVFNNLLKIIHPIAPFISQHLYSKLSKQNLNTVSYNNLNFNINEQSIKNVDLLIEFITKIRSLRNDFNISYSTNLTIYFKNDIPDYIKNSLDLIAKIVKVTEIKSLVEIQKNMLQEVVNQSIIAIELGNFIDIKEEVTRLEKQKNKLQEELDKINISLSNPKFIENAGEARVNIFKENAHDIQLKIDKIINIIQKLSN